MITPAEEPLQPWREPLHAWSKITIPWQDVVKRQGGDVGRFKNELRSRLKTYDASAGVPLARYAMLEGPEETGRRRDAENLLLYNLEEWKKVTTLRPVIRFERRVVTAVCPPILTALVREARFHYLYSVGPVDDAFLPSTRFHTKVLETAEVELKPADFRKSRFILGRVLKTITDMPESMSEIRHRQPFALKIRLRIGSDIHKDEFPIKEVFDGVVAALHYYDFQDLTDVARIMSVEWSVERSVAERLISSRRNRALGLRRFIRVEKKSPVLDPGDDLCHMGELRVEKHPNSTKLSLVAELFA